MSSFTFHGCGMHENKYGNEVTSLSVEFHVFELARVFFLVFFTQDDVFVEEFVFMKLGPSPVFFYFPWMWSA